MRTVQIRDLLYDLSMEIAEHKLAMEDLYGEVEMLKELGAYEMEDNVNE